MSTSMQATLLSRAILAALLAGGLGSAQAVEFSSGELTGSWDTTISYGASWRVQDREEGNIGKANLLDPSVPSFILITRPLEEQIAAPGRWSVNSDDGNQNYDSGDLVANTVSFTTELGFSWRNFGGFFRADGFYDFENADADFLVPPDDDFGDPRDFVAEQLRLLDAYVYWDFEVGDRVGTIRLGNQVVSWGESTFIQGGINVIPGVDVTRLRVPGSELKNAFLPVNSLWGTIGLTDNISIEGLYMFNFEEVRPEPVGSFFSTNDFAAVGGRIVMLGFGLVDEGFTGLGDQIPNLTVPRTSDRTPEDDEPQYGAALRWFLPEFNQTELGFYYLNYHSRLPLISGIAISSTDFGSARYFLEYPEDINLYGLSFNTEWNTISFAGEISYRDNLPLQVDDVELLFAGLSPINALIEAPYDRFQSQLGEVAPGEEISGFVRHEVSQIQLTVTKIFGPGNVFGANQWVVLGEVGATKVWDLPDKSVLRYNGPGTDLGGGPSELSGGNSRNPVTETTPFADSFSWGYRFLTRLDYNNVIGAWSMAPRLAFNHDVVGTSPGPGGNFIEDRKAITLGLGASYLSKWTADVFYTNFFGGGLANELRDRDFAGFSVSYAF